jgi:thymidylate kinase
MMTKASQRINKFISFEGPIREDVQRQMKALQKILVDAGHKVIIANEIESSEKFKEIIKAILTNSNALSNDVQLLLNAAKRMLLHTEVIHPHLGNDYWVLTDAFMTMQMGLPIGLREDWDKNKSTIFKWQGSTNWDLMPDLIIKIENSAYEALTAEEKSKSRKMPGEFMYAQSYEKQMKLYTDNFYDFKNNCVCIDSLQGDENAKKILEECVETGQKVPPKIKLYDSKSLQLFENSSSDKAAIERIKRILDKIKKTGFENRELITVPLNYNVIVDEFISMFPNFKETGEYMRDRFALSMLGDRRLAIPPMLFVGDPGIGKTEAAIWLSERFGTNHRVVDMASSQSGWTLCGSDAFYSNCREGMVFELLAYHKTANPIIVLEELDKIAIDEKSDPSAPLYSLLVKRTAEKFIDMSIRDIEVDASHIIWIGTANKSDLIDKAVLDRFAVFNIAAPTAAQTGQIADSIYRRILSKNEWGSAFPQTLDSTLIQLVEENNCSPRSLYSVIDRAFGIAARNQRANIESTDFIFRESEIKTIGF